MNYRTDLAVEADELLEDAERADETRSGAELSARRAAGYIKKQRQLDEDIAVIEIEILNEEGEKAFQRPRGTYVTIEIQGLFEEKENIRERASRAVAAELKKLIPFDYFLKVLVVGLGNEKVTPDSLGPHTVDKVKITRHLFQMFDCDGDWEMANVSGFNPSVTGVTGMETADLIAEVVSMVKPDVVLVMPAGIPPHKHASATPGELRLAMCECFKALGPQVQVSQWEVDRAGRSYTYNTVSMLQEKYPGAQLYMTIGSDMLETFDEWYRWREILAMVTLVVQSREPGDGDALRAAAQKLEEAGGKIMFADAPVLECASSDIRAGKYPPARLKELLPPPVADVIHRNGLYGKLI